MAAPRASMERYRRLLQELANQCDGAAFWAILDDERVFCLNTATANAKADPVAQRRRGAAVRGDADLRRLCGRAPRISCVDPTSGLKSLLVDVHSHRGHELGSIGVVIRPDTRRSAGGGDALRDSRPLPRDAMTQRHLETDRSRCASNPLPGTAPREASAFARLRSNCRMLALAIVIAVALSLLSPYFLKTNNLLNLLDQSVVTGIVAIGMTFVILTGGIDLSVGSVVGLTGVILGLSLHHFSIPIAIALATLVGRRDRALLRIVDRLFRPRRLRHHARRHGDRKEPCLHILGPDVDQRHPAATERSRLHRRFSASRPTS